MLEKERGGKEEAAVPVKVMKTAKSNIEDIATFTGQIEAGDEVKVVGRFQAG